jgi:hypothetical protein
MPRGLSIHIGLNVVNPAAYGGWNGQLAGCINDARAMQAIAESRGFSASVLLDGQATALAVTRAIGQAAQQLGTGDLLLLTYSGHGGQVPDVNSDEVDAKDETWVLYDRMLVDDELYQLWSQFQPGVRIIMLSDSCHSGTVAQDPVFQQIASLPPLAAQYRRVDHDQPVFRVIPPEVQELAYQQNAATYDTAQWTAGRGDRAAIQASVILISGCQDNQLSADGQGNGLFTEKLLQVWNGGRFQGSHYRFWKDIVQRMPVTQSPNYYKVGQDDPDFEALLPFTISGAGPMTAGPSVKGPPTWARDREPPSFDVTAGPGRFYIFEITSRPELFDITGHGSERTQLTFYGSWSDSPRYSTPRYQLPQAVWDRLKTNARLYYRVGTTSSATTGWDDYQVSTRDNEGLQAPSLEPVAPPQPVAAPSVRGPEEWSHNREAPQFDVTAGPGRFYVFEITSQPELLDVTRHKSERTQLNFYGSWSEYPRLSVPRYQLPRPIWDRLRGAGPLYYRVGTSRSASTYEDYKVSTPDDRGGQAPIIRVL